MTDAHKPHGNCQPLLLRLHDQQPVKRVVVMERQARRGYGEARGIDISRIRTAERDTAIWEALQS